MVKHTIYYFTFWLIQLFFFLSSKLEQFIAFYAKNLKVRNKLENFLKKKNSKEETFLLTFDFGYTFLSLILLITLQSKHQTTNSVISACRISAASSAACKCTPILFQQRIYQKMHTHTHCELTN